MKPLSPEEIRDSFVNASPADLERMALPGLHEVIWADREFLGWRDPQSPQRGYLVHWVDERAMVPLIQDLHETSEAERLLEEVDPDTLTPKEALDLVYRLRRSLEG